MAGSGVGTAVPGGRCAPPGRGPFNSVDAPRQQGGPEPTAPRGYAPERGCRRAWRRRTSYTPGRRGWRLGAGDGGSSPASAEQKRLKVKCPPRACPPRPGPRLPRERRRPGPRAQRHASGMNGSRGRRSRGQAGSRALGLPSRRRRRRRRQRSQEWGWARRRGPALIRAAAPGWRRRGIACSREDAQGHFVTTLLVTGWEGH